MASLCLLQRGRPLAAPIRCAMAIRKRPSVFIGSTACATRMMGNTAPGIRHLAALTTTTTTRKNSHSVAAATTTETTATTTDKSRRQEFKETPIHPSIRRYIETMGVGIPSRRKGSKRQRNDLFQSLEEGRRPGRTGSSIKPPPPFSPGGENESSRDQKKRVVVIGSVAKLEDTFPTNKELVPEVALAGRSNVGKSTLLNALLYGNHPRKARDNDGVTINPDNTLIRKFQRGKTPANVQMPKGIKAVTSDKPGETRKITFYQLSSSCGSGLSADETLSGNVDENYQKHQQVKLRLVDLPGYGFSFTPRDHDGFQSLLLKYLLERGKALKRVLLLVDARHGLKRADIDFLERLQEEASAESSGRRKIPPIQIVLTKCDLVTRDDLARRVVVVRQQLSDTLRRETSALPVLLVSARAGVGFNNIRKNGHSHRARGGVLELQKELAGLVPTNKGIKHDQ